MANIMQTLQGFLGTDYPPDRRVVSDGDQLTCERQAAAQRHLMDGDTPVDRLELLEPQAEDWHCLVCVIMVSFCCIVTQLMKSTKVQNPWHKCSAVVETNCLVAEYRIPYRIGLRTIITHAHRAPLIDGLGHATWSAT